MRDHVLGRDLDDLNAQIHPHHFLEEGDQQNQARPFNPFKSSQSKDYSSFILAQNLYGSGDQTEGYNQHCRDDKHER